MCNILGKLSKKYSEFFFSETIGRMKLKLGLLAYDINLYKNYVFIFSVQLLSLLWQHKASIALKWEKPKLAISAVSLGIIEFYLYRNVYLIVLHIS